MYKIDSLNFRAECYLKTHPELAEYKFKSSESAWTVVEELEAIGHGEFCVVEVND